MNKEIYYYNRKYPEYKITKISVNSEEHTIGKDYDYLSGIYANYDISCLAPIANEHFISLYSPYEDDEIYIHETTFKSELAFSYNLELLNQWRNDDIEHNIIQLKIRLKQLKEEKGDSNE